MNEPQREEFLELLSQYQEGLQLEEKEHRSVEVICQLIAYGSSIGAFSALWKVIAIWISRHASSTVKVTYTAQDNSVVEVTYSQLTCVEAEKLVQERKLKSDRPVKITVKRRKK